MHRFRNTSHLITATVWEIPIPNVWKYPHPIYCFNKRTQRSYLAISNSRSAQKIGDGNKVISSRFWRLSQNSGGSVKSPHHIALNEPIRNNRIACQKKFIFYHSQGSCYQSTVVNPSWSIKIASVHLVLKFDCLNARCWQDIFSFEKAKILFCKH